DAAWFPFRWRPPGSPTARGPGSPGRPSRSRAVSGTGPPSLNSWRERIADSRPGPRLGTNPDSRAGWRKGWESPPKCGTLSALMRIEVVENQIEAALKALKKRMQKEGLFQEMKRRAHYEKPSVKRKRKQAQARRKRRKAMRRQQQPDDD